MFADQQRIVVGPATTQQMTPSTPTRRELVVAALATPALAGAVTGDAASTQSSQTSRTATTEWPMFQGGTAATGAVTSISGPSARAIELEWSVDLDSPRSPVFTGDRIFAASDGVAYALDRESGDGLWRTAFDERIDPYSPAVGHGQLYFAGENGIYALDQRTGEINWRSGTYFSSNFLVRGDSLFTDQHRLDPSNGSVLTAYGGDPPFTASCLADDRFYKLTGGIDNGVALSAYELESGDRVWKTTFEAGNLDDVRAPSYRDGYVYVVAGNAGRVYAVDDVTGTARWSTEVRSETVCSPAVTEERVLLTAGRGTELVALNRDTGDRDWSTSLGSTDRWATYGPSPVVADGTVYVGSRSGHCVAVDEATGERVWRYELDDDVTTAPAVADDAVYVSGGPLYAITNTPNSPPSAVLEYEPRSPVVDEPVEFRGLDSTDDGTVETYEWDLDGDGRFEESGLTASRMFDETGEFEVALRVTDDRGATDTARTTVDVSDENATPTASFTATPDSPITGTTMTFDASASSDPDGGIETYEWVVDDGGVTGTGSVLEHTFTESGEHSIVLTVTDERDATATARRTVRVRERAAGFELSDPDGDVTAGSTATVTLGVTNYLPTDEITVQVRVDAPDGASVAGVQNADSGSGATTAVVTVDPSDRTEAEILFDVEDAGTFDVDVTATYYVADRRSASREYSDTVTITGVDGSDGSASTTVTSTESSTDRGGGEDDDQPLTVNDGSPGFGVGSAVAGGTAALWWKLSGDGDEDEPAD